MLKRSLFYTLLVVSMGFVMAACNKNDDIAPILVVNGNNPDYSPLNKVYVDSGATAIDANGGEVVATYRTGTKNSSFNWDRAGRYTIEYTVIDRAGNKGKAQRVVFIRNDAYVHEGSYYVIDSSNNVAHIPYQQTIKASDTKNRRIFFTKFAGYINNDDIFADIDSTGETLKITKQSAYNLGSGNETHWFTGTGTINSSGIVINYFDSIPGNKIAGTARLKKQ